jgi:hypothetical protein
MANKHSRQGLALGVSLVMGATTLGVLPAQAVDYENLELTISQDDTNGVLATTMENGFELELEWDVADVSDLAYLTYEVTFNTADGSDADVYGVASGISWDAGEDDIVDADPNELFFEDSSAEDGEDFFIDAPAHIIGDDETVDYVYTVSVAGGVNVCSNIIEGDSNTPPVSGAFTLSVTDGVSSGTVPASLTGCSISHPGEDQSVTYNYIYSAGTGFSGSLDEPAPAGFESVILINASSDDDYVDAVVEAWLDKDGDGVKDATESFAAPVTIRFWNETALTPALELETVWGEDDVVDYTVYLTQELNEYYTAELGGVDEDFFAFSDLNYDSQRDGHVFQDYVYDSEDLAFGFDADTFSGKHLFTTGSLNVDNDEISRVGVADYLVTATDDYFSEDSDNVYEIQAGTTKVVFEDRTVDYAQGGLVEQTLAWSYDYVEDGWFDEDNSWIVTADGYIHESVSTVTYIVTAYDSEDEAVAGVDFVINGGWSGNSEEGDITLNDASVIVEDEDMVESGTFEIEGTTNAAGQAVIEIDVETPVDGLDVYFEDFAGQNSDWNVDTTFGEDGDLLWQSSSWNLIGELNMDYNENVVRHVEVGSSTTLVFDVRDQWLQSPANGTAKVEFDFNNASLGNTRDFDGYFGDGTAVSNGRVSVTLPDVDADAGEGSIDVVAELYVKDSNGAYSNDTDAEYTVTLDYLDDAAVETIVLEDASESADVAYTNFWTADFARERMTESLYDTVYAAWNGEDQNWEAGIHGSIENADGLALDGQKVTFSGEGLMFAEYDSAVEFATDGLYGVDSLTVLTSDYDDPGAFDVHVFGHEVGIHTITITAGGKSTTVDFCVGDWALDEDDNDICVSPNNVRAHNVAITSAFAGKAGTADTLTALVTDRYGNVTEGETVTFSKVAGSGYIQETDGTVTTDEDGVATATLIIMSGEIGFNSTVRAAITQDDFAATSNSAAAQRSAGDTNVGKTTAWTKLQTDGTAKMYAKNIVGAGKVQFFHNNKEIAWVRAADALNPKLRAANGAFYLVRTVELVAGKNVLEVYIDGERVRRTAYSK